MKKVPENRISAFKTMCKMNGWNPNEVLTYLIEYAVEQNTALALPLHLRRMGQRSGKTKWKNPYENTDS